MKQLDSVFVCLITALFVVTDAIYESCNGEVFEHKCYISRRITLRRASAEEDCNGMGATLATSDSPRVNIFLHSLRQTVVDKWLGLRVSDNLANPNQWYWSDGTSNSFNAAWEDRYPKSDHTCVLYTHMKWQTHPCNEQKSFMCKRPKPSNGACGHQSEEREHNGHCYRMNGYPYVSNCQASRRCLDRNSTLVSVSDQEEHNFITNWVPNGIFWIGLYPMRWDNGSPYNWQNWNLDGPSTTKKCVTMLLNGTWASTNCAVFNMFICETDMETSTSSTLDPIPSTTPITDHNLTTHHDQHTTSDDDQQYTTGSSGNCSNTSQCVEDNDNDDDQTLWRILFCIIWGCNGLLAIVVVILSIIYLRLKSRCRKVEVYEEQSNNRTAVNNEILNYSMLNHSPTGVNNDYI